MKLRGAKLFLLHFKYLWIQTKYKFNMLLNKWYMTPSCTARKHLTHIELKQTDRSYKFHKDESLHLKLRQEFTIAFYT